MRKTGSVFNTFIGFSQLLLFLGSLSWVGIEREAWSAFELQMKVDCPAKTGTTSNIMNEVWDPAYFITVRNRCFDLDGNYTFAQTSYASDPDCYCNLCSLTGKNGTGKYTPDGKSCLDCPAGTTLARHGCFCPGTQVWNSTTRSCDCGSDKPVLSNGLCCPTGQANANGICCPTGQVNVNGACAYPPITGSTSFPEMSCPGYTCKNSSWYNQGYDTQEDCFNQTKLILAVQCGTGLKYSQTGTNPTDTCGCSPCPALQIVSSDHLTCQACPAGTTPLNNVCTCPPGQDLFNGVCKAACASGAAIINGVCTVCSTLPATPNFKSSTKTCVGPCTQGFQWNSANGGGCVACATGENWNSSTKLCVPACSGNTLWNSISNSCVPCGGATPNFKSSNNTCVGPCTQGLQWNSANGGGCVACATGENWNSSTIKCVPACSGNTVWNSTSNSCTACSSLNSGATPYWDSTIKACANCPPSSPKWDPTANSGVGACLTCSAYGMAHGGQPQYPIPNSNNCSDCPAATPKMTTDGRGCITCIQFDPTKPYFDGTDCSATPNGGGPSPTPTASTAAGAVAIMSLESITSVQRDFIVNGTTFESFIQITGSGTTTGLGANQDVLTAQAITLTITSGSVASTSGLDSQLSAQIATCAQMGSFNMKSSRGKYLFLISVGDARSISGSSSRFVIDLSNLRGQEFYCGNQNTK